MIGKHFTLTATVKPDDATNKTVRWTSSNEDAATVSDEGVITGKNRRNSNNHSSCNRWK